jgi:hypothetical protein
MNTVKEEYAFEVDGIDYPSGDGRLDGRQVRSKSGHDPAGDYVLIRIQNRYTASVGLQDDVDLAVGEKPVFRCFESDRDFQFEVDELGWAWGASTILEQDVRTIGRIADDREIVVEMVGEPEIVVPRGGIIDLVRPGVERIYSRVVRVSISLNVTFVINGEPVPERGKPDEKLLTLLEKALIDSENTGQLPNAWQVTDEPGNVLDVDRTLAELGIREGAILLASLKAGAAG